MKYIWLMLIFSVLNYADLFAQTPDSSKADAGIANSDQLIFISKSGSLRPGQTDEMYTYLATISNKKLDKRAPVLIIIDPDNKACDITGFTNPEDKKRWYTQLIKKLNRHQKINALALQLWQKDTMDVIMPTYYDKDRKMIKVFCPHAVPACLSVILFNPKGQYWVNLETYEGHSLQDKIVKRAEDLFKKDQDR
jgi:hypothetical protein